MKLFSKKTLVCESCGKEYEAMIAVGAKLCPECAARLKQKKASIAGYEEYAAQFNKKFTEKEMDEILRHRYGILEKYSYGEDAMTLQELKELAANRKNLTEEQCANAISRLMPPRLAVTQGTAFSGQFFAPTTYDGVVVDADDVFAVGLAKDWTNINGEKRIDRISCTLFTNDPYIPVFSVVFAGKIKFWAYESTEGREAAAHLFTKACKNLTYRVQPLKELKKQIKNEDEVRGNLEKKFVLDQIGVLNGGYDPLLQMDELSAMSTAMLGAYGYMTDDEIIKQLKMDRPIEGAFWRKRMKKAGYEIL